MKYLSSWRVFTVTKKKKNAEVCLNLLLKENSSINVAGEIEYSVYHKDDTIICDFKCEHEADSWEGIVYDALQTIQGSAYGVSLSGWLGCEVSAFCNGITGANGGVKAIGMNLSKE